MCLPVSVASGRQLQIRITPNFSIGTNGFRFEWMRSDADFCKILTVFVCLLFVPSTKVLLMQESVRRIIEAEESRMGEIYRNLNFIHSVDCFF